MSFDPLTENEPAPSATAPSNAVTASRLKRQLVDQAIDAARRADWAAAAEINERILEMGPDSAAENRTAKAYWELGELGNAREHYQSALALDPTNRVAERNIGRLRMLMVDAGSKTVPAMEGSKAPVSIFVEETGKTGFAHLVDLASPIDLAQVNPGDFVELSPSGPRIVAKSNGVKIGAVEPRVAARLLKLMADGNKYAAGVTSLGDADVRIIIRETYQDPSNYGKVSFPTAAKVSDLRPYTKGTLVREEADLEEDLEFDEEPESLEDVGSVLPAEERAEEGFQIEGEDSGDDDDDDLGDDDFDDDDDGDDEVE
jgi:tetratricopeptide (TPR) repeat protein